MSNVVIIGSGRSGTSIIGELFEHVPGFVYLFEPQVDEFESAFKCGICSRIAAKVPKCPPPLTPGLACDFDRVLEIMGGESRFIWVVRNPLDAICSLKPGIEADWSHNPKPPNWGDLIGSPWFIRAAHHWNYINSVGFSSCAARCDPMVVTYERFVRFTNQTVSSVLRHVNAPELDGKSSAMIQRYIDSVSDSTLDSYHAKFQVHWFVPDHDKRIGRYRHNLTDKEIQECLTIVGDTAQRFGYMF